MNPLPSGHRAAPTLVVRALAKRYGDTPVFQGVDLDVAPGEFLAIVGESGVGKSSLLNCLAGLDSWTAGSITHDGTDLSSLDDDRRAVWRRQHLGFVFQAFHVLPHLDVAQNVGLPLLLLGRPDPQRVRQMLAAVGLAGLEHRLPAELSGGQLQRVAIARALVHRPGLLLADEPTGNLDPSTAAQIMDLLQTQARETGAAVVLVTHSQAAAARADRVLELTARGCGPAAPSPQAATMSANV
ncbi:MAG: ABC transporter ATP-binding protein [Burkholderiales bacterium]|nr:MAG: ABC transporter ATP-binding protein [Burkholderiales bacterium]